MGEVGNTLNALIWPFGDKAKKWADEHAPKEAKQAAGLLEKTGGILGSGAKKLIGAASTSKHLVETGAKKLAEAGYTPKINRARYQEVRKPDGTYGDFEVSLSYGLDIRDREKITGEETTWMEEHIPGPRKKRGVIQLTFSELNGGAAYDEYKKYIEKLVYDGVPIGAAIDKLATTWLVDKLKKAGYEDLITKEGGFDTAHWMFARLNPWQRFVKDIFYERFSDLSGYVIESSSEHAGRLESAFEPSAERLRHLARLAMRDGYYAGGNVVIRSRDFDARFGGKVNLEIGDVHVEASRILPGSLEEKALGDKIGLKDSTALVAQYREELDKLNHKMSVITRQRRTVDENDIKRQKFLQDELKEIAQQADGKDSIYYDGKTPPRLVFMKEYWSQWLEGTNAGLLINVTFTPDQAAWLREAAFPRHPNHRKYLAILESFYAYFLALADPKGKIMKKLKITSLANIDGYEPGKTSAHTRTLLTAKQETALKPNIDVQEIQTNHPIYDLDNQEVVARLDLPTWRKAEYERLRAPRDKLINWFREPATSESISFGTVKANGWLSVDSGLMLEKYSRNIPPIQKDIKLVGFDWTTYNRYLRVFVPNPYELSMGLDERGLPNATKDEIAIPLDDLQPGKVFRLNTGKQFLMIRVTRNENDEIDLDVVVHITDKYADELELAAQSDIDKLGIPQEYIDNPTIENFKRIMQLVDTGKETVQEMINVRSAAIAKTRPEARNTQYYLNNDRQLLEDYEEEYLYDVREFLKNFLGQPAFNWFIDELCGPNSASYPISQVNNAGNAARKLGELFFQETAIMRWLVDNLPVLKVWLKQSITDADGDLQDRIDRLTDFENTTFLVAGTYPLNLMNKPLDQQTKELGTLFSWQEKVIKEPKVDPAKYESNWDGYEADISNYIRVLNYVIAYLEGTLELDEDAHVWFQFDPNGKAVLDKIRKTIENYKEKVKAYEKLKGRLLQLIELARQEKELRDNSLLVGLGLLQDLRSKEINITVENIGPELQQYMIDLLEPYRIDPTSTDKEAALLLLSTLDLKLGKSYTEKDLFNAIKAREPYGKKEAQPDEQSIQRLRLIALRLIYIIDTL